MTLHGWLNALKQSLGGEVAVCEWRPGYLAVPSGGIEPPKYRRNVIEQELTLIVRNRRTNYRVPGFRELVSR